ncbi:uncharacterized protein LOC110096041 isoform X3 [Dendrobium catenatum]|uniref:uncharacterized protein LOC110096041 isoform X3 n=1 Tax=Dendrobium catenatum TaxID=906689 RepID=UPI0009F2DB3C|nr:uncharacterized protein LOC110096041 isoform X3 [Dendrobium catenatum]
MDSAPFAGELMMLMSSFTDSGDGPAILKLVKWDHLPYHLKPSELSEVSISPTRNLLLLLSYQSEALLLPLTAGLRSFYYLKDGADTSCHLDHCPVPIIFTEFPTSTPVTVKNPTESFENPCEVSSASFGSCALISNVKSFAWGHYGDSYGHFEQSDFREFLLVCTDDCFTFHSFRYPNKGYQGSTFVKESGPFNGNWVEWGPSSSIHTKEKYLDVDGCENKFGDDKYYKTTLEQKKWLQTFLTEVDASWCGNKYLAKFPIKSSYPKSAAVLSFDLSSATMKFLESCLTTHPFDETKSDPEIPVSAVHNPPLPDNQASLHSAAGFIGSSYKCSRVFSGSLHNQLGLVLTSPEHVIVENEVHKGGNVIVVVIMLYYWGVEWVCSIDLEKPYHGPGPGYEWADFQFLDTLLVCLSTSGLTCIWCAKTGNPIASFDVVESCEVNLNVRSQLNQLKTPEADSWRGESMRNFKSLMVTPCSFLLAAADEHGVIYVVDADDHISGHLRNKIISPSQDSALGVLASWDVAGKGIGCQKVFADISNSLCLDGSGISKGDLTGDKQGSVILPGKWVRKRINDKENGLEGYISGSNILSEVKDHLEISHSKKKGFSTPIRRLHLPPKHNCSKDSVCFSPFGVTRLLGYYGRTGEKLYNFFHTDLHVSSTVADDRNLDNFLLYKRCFKKDVFVGESLGFSFKGNLYVLTQEGLFVILPSVSFPCIVPSIESASHWKLSTASSKYEMNGLLAVNEPHELWRPWQMEVFDKTLFFEGPEVAEAICLDNGWDLQVARLRRMQLGLHYLKFDEIKESLDMLVDANLAEEGILHLLFTSVYLLFCKAGNDNEASLASRLLALAACFATKMIRKYGSAEHKGEKVLSPRKDFKSVHMWKRKHFQKFCGTSNSRMLSGMALLLEVIRNLQNQLSSKDRRLLLDMRDGKDMRDMVNGENLQNNSMLPIALAESVSLSVLDSVESQAKASLLQFNELEDEALSSAKPSSSQVNLNEIYVPEADPIARSKILHLENPKETITRWKKDSPDLKTVVEEALCYDRLPLAVLHVHLQRHGDQMDEKQRYDNFTEVCEIGRAIAYDLFLKGESTLAVETLLRLGEDLELTLRQLLLGTVRRSLRAQIAKEMESYGYLRRTEMKILERISLIERLYPSSSFWFAYHGKQKDGIVSSANWEVSKAELKFHVNDSFIIECGDIDGVILGSWANLDDGPAFSVVDEENVHAAYWACAATWADAWDQRTIDRVVLDQSIDMSVSVSWESQLEFHLSHNNFEEVHKLIGIIPPTLLSDETLKINLKHSSSNSGNDAMAMGYLLDICASGEVEPVCLFIPNIKVFRFSAVYMCSSWLKVLVEQELARKYIFLKDYWESTAELMPLITRAGLIINASEISTSSQFSDSSLGLDAERVTDHAHNDTAEALHRLIMCYCTQHNFPHFLDLYLDHHNLVLDDDTLCSLREAAGDCQWAKWLLFLRVRGYEHEASFFNARSILSKQMANSNKLNVNEVDEIIKTVDDMAEGGGELAALATLMYESAPLQKFLCTGSVSRHCTSSSQCTLENLKPGLEKFPTLWRTLVSACFGTDSVGISTSSSLSKFFGKSAFSDYLRCRDSLFSSAGGDTSLVQMLPCWFPKSVRRLVRLFAQVPLGWQSFSSALTFDASILCRENNYVFNGNVDGINPVSWEASIQKSVEEELYSSIEEDGSGMEQHLHRSRALAAFNHLLSLRASKLKEATEHQEPLRQTNIQSDVQAILSSLSLKEWSLLPSVIQLAVMHFDDPALVASCTFLLELCGVSASMLRIDIAALLRISDYYTSIRQNTHDVSPKGSSIYAESHEGDITYSLARALADNYIYQDNLMPMKQKEVKVNDSKGKQLLQPLLIVLQHLEKASLPSLEEGKTCGFWLSSGIGDGFEFRSQQKDASQHWKLVTEFCQIHNLPLSIKYLALLANDNDWVGFLMEAQIRLFPTDTVIKVAAKEFSNPRLKMHVLTVLKSMPSMRKNQSSSLNTSSGSSHMVVANDSETMVPVELFGLIAMCERQKNPGEALLIKAKNLRWSLLAMIASCFPDVSPVSCLTVWLEITAARETSSIKVNDISSKVAENVKAAVEATNALPSGCRTLSFHYNRRNSKRRRLLDPSSGSPSSGSTNITPMVVSVSEETLSNESETSAIPEQSKISSDPDEALTSLSNMVAVLCEQHLFLPLLRAFELFLPSCALLPFIRSLQAFFQMRLSEASVHLTSFSSRIKDESFYMLANMQRDGILKATWIISTAAKAAEAMLSTCPSAYEKRCLLQLLAGTDFGDGGSTSIYFQRLHWKINLAEPSLRKDEDLDLGDETLGDDSLLAALENNGRWDQARNWARQLESAGASWKCAVHHVTETQAEAMVAEWKEFLWDVPEERAALWAHCHTLFVRYSFPALQAGLFFLRHADAIEKGIPARELHEMLLFALQWLSGYITQIPPVYPLHLLREIETRVWLLAVESEAQAKIEGDYNLPSSIQHLGGGNSVGIIEQTATIIEKMDGHINATCLKVSERNGSRENCMQLSRPNQASDSTNSGTMSCSTRIKRRTKNHPVLKRPMDNMDTNNDSDDSPKSPQTLSIVGDISKSSPLQEENVKIEASVSGWEEKVRPADMERAVLSLLEFGQVTAAKQLQHKLSPAHVPFELAIVDAALKVASLSSSSSNEGRRGSMMDAEVLPFIQSLNIHFNSHAINPLQVLESLTSKCGEGCGRGICWRIIAVVKASKVLGLAFSEAFEIRPIELLQLLSLKAQDSLEEARLLVQTHFIPPASIARILAESFLKGLLAAHRGGYMDSQKEEGPAPLLWRFSDFLKWAELCPSEPEIGHALMRLVMTGQEIPHACEVELLILSHHFYKSSACLDGVDVLVTLAANRVESYVSEGDFSCLARLVTGVSNFHALNFILNILIENGQLELLLNKYTTPDTVAGSSETIRGFRMAVLTSLKIFNPHDLDSFAMAYSHFDMKHETASLLDSRSLQHMHRWLSHPERDRQTEELLEAMRYLIEAAEVFSTIDAGHKTRYACARAALLFLQIRIPDLTWIELSETNARRVLVEQSRFQVALVVAEAYGLNQPNEWAPVLWNQMLRPDLLEEFVTEFVLVLPLHPSMLLELARFYRSEVAARVDQSHFSVWLSHGGLPAEWVKNLGKSFRSLLRRTRDLRLRVQLATTATGFEDVINACNKVLDKVPDNAGPLILRRGHGGAYVALM